MSAQSRKYFANDPEFMESVVSKNANQCKSHWVEKQVVVTNHETNTKAFVNYSKTTCILFSKPIRQRGSKI